MKKMSQMYSHTVLFLFKLTGATATFSNQNYQVQNADNQNNIITYTAPDSLTDNRTNDEITVQVQDSAGATSQATIKIYFYHDNNHPNKPLNIENISTRMGDLTPANTIIWDIDNLTGFSDTVSNNSIKYTVISNSKFSIDSTTGYLKTNPGATFNNESESVRLTAEAVMQNNEHVAVQFLVTIAIINSINFDEDNNGDGIPNEIENVENGELILNDDFEFDDRFSDYNKENVTLKLTLETKLKLIKQN